MDSKQSKKAKQKAKQKAKHKPKQKAKQTNKQSIEQLYATRVSIIGPFACAKPNEECKEAPKSSQAKQSQAKPN